MCRCGWNGYNYWSLVQLVGVGTDGNGYRYCVWVHVLGCVQVVAVGTCFALSMNTGGGNSAGFVCGYT